jgi:hypothetical protein
MGILGTIPGSMIVLADCRKLIYLSNLQKIAKKIQRIHSTISPQG